MVEGAKTAMRRAQPSAPAKWLADEGLLVGRMLDFGSGRGKDALTYKMDAWDPYWRPLPKPVGPYDTIICVYVLNVVSLETQKEVLRELDELLAEGGTAYVAVRRDLPKKGQQGRGIWQRYVTLKADLVHENKGFAIYGLRKSSALASDADSTS